MEPYRIVVADDHSLIRQGIKSIIAEDGAMRVVGEAANGLELLDILAEQEPHLVILDICMPNMNGIEAVGQVKETHPEVKILIVTMYGNNHYFYKAIDAGVDGYLLKEESDAELLKAIEAVRNNRSYVSPQLSQDISDDMIAAFREQASVPVVSLSERERQVLRLVVQGNTSKKIAAHLRLSPRTVDHHRASLLKKFNMKNTIDLVNYVVRNNLFLDEG
ncbi:response regulator [Desulfogranum mediterraneum]|uniref:response regulator n=1 Tax=Desulfogranum mediterraneum TaxID=160661 RepID=UPI0004112AF5|nr:response regulator transcription factor [Desulfogranum mediterraneum]